MDSIKNKTKIYMLIISLIMSLLGIAAFRSSQNSLANGKGMTPTQEMEALEKGSPKSPEMSRFLKQEKATREADQEAAGDLPK